MNSLSSLPSSSRISIKLLQALGCACLLYFADSCSVRRQIPFSKHENEISLIRVTKGMEELSFGKSDSTFIQLMVFIKNQEENWNNPSIGTYPTPNYTIAFSSDSALLFPVWIGANWIGIRYEGKEFIKNISETELDRLIEIFDFDSLTSAASIAMMEEDSISKTISLLFEGMRNGDSAMVRSAFHSNSSLQTTYTNPSGNVVLKDETLQEFLVAVGTSHKEVWDERIYKVRIEVDLHMAHAWVPYEFYIDGSFSHCGVNAMQFIKENGKWKILRIIDTRRKSGCITK